MSQANLIQPSRQSCLDESRSLAKQHPHPRDLRIQFEEKTHTYTVDGRPQDTYISVTTLVHSWFPTFDGFEVASKMVAKASFLSGAAYGQYQCLRYDQSGQLLPTSRLIQKILAKWKVDGQTASALGTQLHLSCERFYNGLPVHHPTIEYGFFLSYADCMAKKGFVPFRTEMKLFLTRERIAGCVDMLFQDAQGRFRLRDWKRSKAIRYHGFGQTCKGALSHLNNCNFSHFCLQLNLYQYILEHEYGMDIFDRAIVVFHPNQSSYEEIEVPLMMKEIEIMMNQRRKDLGQPQTRTK